MIARRLTHISNPANLVYVLTTVSILASILVPMIFGDLFFRTGRRMLDSLGAGELDAGLYILTAVSSTPLALPVWCYAVLGRMLGMEPVRLITVIGSGAATGSTMTYLLGRYFGNTRFARKHFPGIENHQWTSGRSVRAISLLLFAGALSPLPFDVMYAACGAKRYPVYLFTPIVFLAWTSRITLLVWGFGLLQSGLFRIGF